MCITFIGRRAERRHFCKCIYLIVLFWESNATVSELPLVITGQILKKTNKLSEKCNLCVTNINDIY